MTAPLISAVDNEEGTASLAKKLSTELVPGDIVSLIGNLGAGKTFFIRKVCSEWNIHNVNSPTFAIVNQYNGLNKVYHFDFYRINNAAELIDIGFNDYLNDEEAVIFIEWGNLFSEILPDRRIDINIEILHENRRNFSILRHV